MSTKVCDPCGIKSTGQASCFRRVWFPVLLDLTLEAYRSRLLVLCSSVTFLLAMLSKLLIHVQPCAVGLLSVNKAYVEEHLPDVARWGDAADVLRWVAPFFSLVASSRWHSAWWLLPAFLAGGAYLILLSTVDARFCFVLLPYGSTPVTQFDGSSDGIAGAGQVLANVTGNGTSTDGFDGDVVTASMMASVRLFDWFAALVAASLLLHLLWQHVIVPSMRAGRPFTLSQELAAAAGIAHGPCGPLGPGVNSDCFCFGECCDDNCGDRAAMPGKQGKQGTSDRSLLLPINGAAASYQSIADAPAEGAHLPPGRLPEALLPPMSPSDAESAAAAASAVGDSGSLSPDGTSKGRITLIPAAAAVDPAARSARYGGVARPGRPLPQLLRSYLLYRWHCARLRLRLRLPDARHQAALAHIDASWLAADDAEAVTDASTGDHAGVLEGGAGCDSASVLLPVGSDWSKLTDARLPAGATTAAAAPAAAGDVASAAPTIPSAAGAAATIAVTEGGDAVASGISLHIRGDHAGLTASLLAAEHRSSDSGSAADGHPRKLTGEPGNTEEDPLAGIDLSCCGLLADGNAALNALLGLVPLRQWQAVAAGVCAMTTLQLWLASLLGDASSALSSATFVRSPGPGVGSDGLAGVLHTIQDAIRTLLGAGSAAQTCVFIAGVGTMAVSIYLVALDTTTLLEYHRHRWDSRWAQRRRTARVPVVQRTHADESPSAAAAPGKEHGILAAAVGAESARACTEPASAAPAASPKLKCKTAGSSHAPPCSSGAACASCCGRWTGWLALRLRTVTGLGPVTVDLARERQQESRRRRKGASDSGDSSDCAEECACCSSGDDARDPAVPSPSATATAGRAASSRRKRNHDGTFRSATISSSRSAARSSSVPANAFVLDLPAFAFIDAFTFILSYLTTLLAISALLGIVLTALIFVLTFGPLRSWLLTFVLTLVLAALYRAAVKAAFACCVADSTRIFSPRLFAALDIALSFTTSLLIGTTQGIVRVLLAVVWALLSTSQLARPVLPASLGLARLDSGFAAYGGMHKARLAWLPLAEPHDDPEADLAAGSGDSVSGAPASDASLHSPSCPHNDRAWEVHADALLQLQPDAEVAAAAKVSKGSSLGMRMSPGTGGSAEAHLAALSAAAAALGLAKPRSAALTELAAHTVTVASPAAEAASAGSGSPLQSTTAKEPASAQVSVAMASSGRRFSVTGGIVLPRRGAECASNVLDRLNLV